MLNKESIRHAEELLLSDGCTFDNERLHFINCFETCDLLAVPGSGKTTALLAKLMCMVDAQPFDSNSGILVLAHTNVAVEEIRNKLSKSHPSLFQYPNFVGTIQSFINKYLAIPYYIDTIGYRPHIISKEKYDEAITRRLSFVFKGKTAYLKNNNPSIFYDARFSIDTDGKKYLSSGMEGDLLDFKVPNGWVPSHKESIKREIAEWKSKIMMEGILHFDDCYFLANRALLKNPRLKEILKKRFEFVFIDEMQDLEKHQIDIIDNIFYEEKSTNIIQRIGDKNQAIYSSTKKMKDFSVWKSRNEKYLGGSHRLTDENARIIDRLTLDNASGKFGIVGRRVIDSGSIPPHLIVFNPSNMGNLLAEFDGLISKFQKEGKIPDNPAHPFKIIAWNSEWPDNENLGEERIRLKDIFPTFSKIKKKKKRNFNSLEEFVTTDFSEFKSVRESLLNILVKILALEGIKYKSQIHGKNVNLNYSKSKIIELIKELGVYEAFKLKTYTCCKEIMQGNIEEAYFQICDFIRNDLKDWFKLKLSNETEEFLGEKPEKEIKVEESETNNTDDGSDYSHIKVSTVHSSKGQTHCATMYVETFFHKYETQHIPEPLLGKAHGLKIENDKDKRKKHAIKMMYVGLSRPTHFLCLAVLHDNVRDDLEHYERAGWKIHNMCIS